MSREWRKSRGQFLRQRTNWAGRRAPTAPPILYHSSQEISSDSVQLLVSASQQNPLEAPRQKFAASEEEEEAKEEEKETENAEEKKPVRGSNDLLMMQEPYSPAQRHWPGKTSQPQREEANNDTGCVAKSESPARAFSEASGRPKPLCESAGASSPVLCPPTGRRQAPMASTGDREPKKSTERRLSDGCADGQATIQGDHQSGESSAGHALGRPSSSSALGSKSASASPLSPASPDSNRCQPQSMDGAKRPRQSELLQLVRLRQQQQAAAAAAINSSNSQDLPTLQQLQQQIQQIQQQQQRSNNSQAAPTRLQQLQHQQQQQQQRMHQWTAAAAAMLQQQQRQQEPALATQQRQQQQQPVQQPTHSRPGNEGAATANTATTTTATRLPEEMEQQQEENGNSVAENQNNSIRIDSTRIGSSRILASPANSAATKKQVGTTNYNITEPADDEQVAGDNGPQQQQQHQQQAARQRLMPAQTLLTTAAAASDELNLNNTSPQQEPVALPRSGALVTQQQQMKSVSNKTTLQDELSILTNTTTSSTSCLMNPRVRDLTSDVSQQLSISPASQSTPPASILSDSTTLIREAAMSSADMIPKLIERLDGKLIVMKEAQLSLMRDIELNECTGQRLFDSLRRQLSASEFEKITLHVNEIEKVTKLILSLKMRLKRTEGELKERTVNGNKRAANDNTSSGNGSSLASPELGQHESNQSQQHTSQNHNNNQLVNSSSASIMSLPARDTTGCLHNNKGQQASVRGVSDPTSTIGLPKRNHQHHASLQVEPLPADQLACGRLLAFEGPATGGSGPARQYSLSSCDSGSSPVCSPRQTNQQHHHQHLHPLEESSTGNNGREGDNESGGAKTASTSSDSIFNCADSAIGSTITGHGGSSNNIQEQPTISQSSLTSSSSSSSSASSTSSRSNHQSSNSPSQSHLSSTISVSSQSSMSSVPNSPALVSPAGTVNNSYSTVSNSHQQTGASYLKKGSSSPNDNSTVASVAVTQANTTNTSLNISGLSAVFKPDGNNNANNSSINNSTTTTTSSDNPNDSMLHLLTDIDILIAKRNKLISQLDEAHQLEECIIHRNNIIIQRILKKYYKDMGGQEGEIAEFKQFTHLKSLLLKDTHDVADRIESAELQLTELRQTNQCI